MQQYGRLSPVRGYITSRAGGIRGRDSIVRTHKPRLSGEAATTRGLPGGSSDHNDREDMKSLILQVLRCITISLLWTNFYA